jgi:hypothetical protein
MGPSPAVVRAPGQLCGIGCSWRLLCLAYAERPLEVSSAASGPLTCKRHVMDRVKRNLAPATRARPDGSKLCQSADKSPLVGRAAPVVLANVVGKWVRAGLTREADMTNGAEAGSSGASAHRASSEIPLPFCGDEYPPLKGSPGAVICTKACHPETQMHQNEETGWVWWYQ